MDKNACFPGPLNEPGFLRGVPPKEMDKVITAGIEVLKLLSSLTKEERERVVRATDKFFDLGLTDRGY